MSHELVDGNAVQNLRRRFGMTPGQLARMTGLTEAQVNQLEQGGASHFKSADHKIRCALKVASSLSGVQPNGLPRANVFAEPVVPWRPVKYEDTPEFYKMLLMIFVVSFILIGVVLPILFGTEPPPKVERIATSSR